MGGFVDSPPPTPEASEDEDNDGDIDAENDGANSSSADEMSIWYTYPLSLVKKGGVVLDIRVVIFIGGSIGDFC